MAQLSYHFLYISFFFHLVSLVGLQQLISMKFSLADVQSISNSNLTKLFLVYFFLLFINSNIYDIIHE